MLAKRAIGSPLSDDEIALRVKSAFGAGIFRRAIGISGKVGRAESEPYREDTADFSTPFVLSSPTVREMAPAAPGVD